MQNKEICYGWLVFCKKFLINSWKFVLKKYSLNSHHSRPKRKFFKKIFFFFFFLWKMITFAKYCQLIR